MKLNEYPTPETDAELDMNVALCGSYAASPEFARKLERERDEALETLEAWRVRAESWGTDPDEVRRRILALTKERDDWKGWHEACRQGGQIIAKERDEAQREREAAVARVREVEEKAAVLVALHQSERAERDRLRADLIEIATGCGVGCPDQAEVEQLRHPKLNIRCECQDGVVHGSTSLNVVRVEQEDDGSFTAVTDHWPINVDEVASLKDWKESALAVEREWDVQKLANLLGAPLGSSCRKAIAEKVPQLIAEVEQLRAQAEGYAQHVGAPTLAEAWDVLLRTKQQDEATIASMYEKIKTLGKQKAALRERIERFVARVEAGTIKSTWTYELFKQVLEDTK